MPHRPSYWNLIKCTTEAVTTNIGKNGNVSTDIARTSAGSVSSQAGITVAGVAATGPNEMRGVTALAFPDSNDAGIYDLEVVAVRTGVGYSAMAEKEAVLGKDGKLRSLPQELPHARPTAGMQKLANKVVKNVGSCLNTVSKKPGGP